MKSKKLIFDIYHKFGQKNTHTHAHAHKHEKAQLTSYQGSTTYHLLNNTLELTK